MGGRRPSGCVDWRRAILADKRGGCGDSAAPDSVPIAHVIRTTPPKPREPDDADHDLDRGPGDSSEARPPSPGASGVDAGHAGMAVIADPGNP